MAEHEYRVKWEIEVVAESPAAAARKAQTIQRDPESLATAFDVYDKSTRVRARVDLYVSGTQKRHRTIDLGVVRAGEDDPDWGI